MSFYMNLLFAAEAGRSYHWSVYLIAVVLTLLVPFFLGEYLGKKLRMSDHGWKIGLCLFTLAASIAVIVLGPPLKKGVDLSGGVILVYEVDQSKKTQGEAVDMDKLIAAVARRVNPGGQKEVTIRKYGVEQVEVIVPEVDDAEVQRIERIISTTGNLEFRILASMRQNKDIVQLAQADPSKREVRDSKQNLLAWWVPVKEGQEEHFSSDVIRRTRKIGARDVTEILVVKDTYDVNGSYLTRSSPGSDEKGQPCVHFNFNSRGAQLFGQLTGDHLPDTATNFYYLLGIILDNEMYSAPRINSRIDASGEISGNFTQKAVKDLVDVLNAGSLPAALTKEPISKLYTGATLGADTIEKSTRAMLIAVVLVPLFMLWYYRFAGIVANIALVLNMLMLVAIMLTIKAAFTLTGFAALALTVGMAVDNNVLVFERLREELGRGATLRMAIRNAFQRAGTTIIDCNLTHLIAASVLYMVGTDQLRGFAVPLWLGTAISLYTSVFVAHVVFEIAEKRQWITKLKMLHLIGHTNIDFMGWFPLCASVSVAITLMAITVSVIRGQGLFDIDFTGGVSVQALFNEKQDTGQVRELLGNRLPDLAISDVRIANQEPGLRFEINTSEQKLPVVMNTLSEVFGDKLARNAANFTAPALIEAKAKETPVNGSAAPKKEAPATDAPEKKPPESPNKDQSRNDLPSRTLLAAADADSVLLAMADDKPADEKPAAEKPAAEKAAAEKPADVPVIQPAVSPAAAESVVVPSHSKAQTPRKQATPAAGLDLGKTPATEKPLDVGPDPFAGGSLSHLTFDLELNHGAVEQLMASAIETAKVSAESPSFSLSNPEYTEGDQRAYKEWDLKILLSPEKTQTLLTGLKQHIADSPIFPASSQIGAAVAGNTQLVAIYALVASWVCIIIYLWVRFQGVAFGFAAVIALIHDVFVMLGGIAVSIYVAPLLGFLMVEPFKINLPIVAAFLTIIGYSVNDTIVVFDRIREVRGKNPGLTRKMVNDSTNQTMSRTLLTSFTVLLVVIVLYFFGGDALHGFAFALVIGVATGTYSSIYVAAPILLWLVGKHKEGAA
jgi:SecD/SecF fusion protein